MFDYKPAVGVLNPATVQIVLSGITRKYGATPSIAGVATVRSKAKFACVY